MLDNTFVVNRDSGYSKAGTEHEAGTPHLGSRAWEGPPEEAVLRQEGRMHVDPSHAGSRKWA